MTPPEKATLSQVITEITYRAVSKVGPEFGITNAKGIAMLAEALATKIEDAVVTQGFSDQHILKTFTACDLDTYQVFCAVLDEIQKSIPVVARLNVTVEISRIQGRKCRAATTTDRDNGGEAQGLDA